jgi:hypothetical protein
MDWFVVTSHNMSKAAWGEVQNSSRHGSGDCSRHWELGVFLPPQTLRAERLVPLVWSEGHFRPGDVTVPQPYSSTHGPTRQVIDIADTRYGE